MPSVRKIFEIECDWTSAISSSTVNPSNLVSIMLSMKILKKDLSEIAGISPATITKMGKGGHVTTEVLVKICAALDCKVEDIMEIIPEKD